MKTLLVAFVFLFVVDAVTPVLAQSKTCTVSCTGSANTGGRTCTRSCY
jgi:hypothetical protein